MLEKNMLLVTGNNTVRENIRRIMWGLGFSDVFIVENGKRALDFIAKHNQSESSLDLIITDQKMSPLSGIGLIGQLRQAGDGIPVILLYDDLGLIEQKELRAISKVCLLKKKKCEPFTTGDLREAIGTTIRPRKRAYVNCSFIPSLSAA